MDDCWKCEKSVDAEDLRDLVFEGRIVGRYCKECGEELYPVLPEEAV